MARNLTPQAIAAKWKTRTSGASQDYRDGVNAATDWAAKSQAAAPRRNAGLQQAIANGSIDRGIAATGDAGWKQATLAKVSNWTTGVNASQDKMARAMTTVMADIDAARGQIANMPTDSLAARLDRSRAFQEAMAARKQQRGSRA